MGTMTTSERVAALSAAAEALAQSRQYLSFVVGTGVFGSPIRVVKEILEYRQPTEVPMMPGYMRGVINLRGRVVPVIDLAVRFGRTAQATTRRSCIVVVEIEQAGVQQDIGVAVDAVSAVLDIAQDDIEPAPSFGAHIRADFITGMGKVGEKFVIILDMDKVLSVEELASLAGIAQQASAAVALSAQAAAPASAEARA